MSAHRLPYDEYLSPMTLPDPGSGGTLSVTRQMAYFPIVTAAAEARTLAAPLREGLVVRIVLKTYGGALTLTVTGGYNQAGTTSLTFGDAGDWACLHSVEVGGTYYWRVLESEGINLVRTDLTVSTLTVTTAVLTSGSVTSTFSAASGSLLLPSDKTVVTSTSLTAADSSKMIVVNTTTDVILTLPSTADGLRYDFFILTTAGSGKLHSISPASADKIMGKGITASDNKDLQNTQATAAVGDSVTLVADGADGWYAQNISGTWARET